MANFKSTSKRDDSTEARMGMEEARGERGLGKIRLAGQNVDKGQSKRNETKRLAIQAKIIYFLSTQNTQ